MATVVEVFADVTCPFAHVGLERVAALLAERDRAVEVWVRAWPLEWVNGSPLEADAVAAKAAILHDRLGVDAFDGFRPDRWPTSTIPALDLTAAGYAVDRPTGLAVALGVRDALFRRGDDIGDPAVLAAIADEHGIAGVGGVDHAPTEASRAVLDDFAEGGRRGVRGSPHFWVGSDDFFCPALVIGHDDHGGLTADFDPEGLTAFLDAATAH